VILTGGNRHDSTQLIPLLNAPSPPYAASEGDPAAAPSVSTPTERTTPTLIVDRCAPSGSPRTSSGRAPHTALAWHLPSNAQSPEPVQEGECLFDDPSVYIHEAFMILACGIICYRRLTR
jgi:hypothetical protein